MSKFTLDPVGGEIDVDHQDADFVAHRHQRYAELRETCPVVHNAAYGGFWIVTDSQNWRCNADFFHATSSFTKDDPRLHAALANWSAM